MSDRPVHASLAAAGCFLRSFPRFFFAAPKTPLRVLGIMALDTLHVLRAARPLPDKKITELAMLLDFFACANAACDHKALCEPEYRVIRQRLEQAGFGACIEAHLDRLRALESRRPRIGGDHRRFRDACSYREAVARLCVATAIAMTFDADSLEGAILATRFDADVDALVRILLQCQIIDDVLDYKEDLSGGLPSFLTVTASLSRALELTSDAARSYGSISRRSSSNAVFPLRMVLSVITDLTTVIVRLAHWRHRYDRPAVPAPIS